MTSSSIPRHSRGAQVPRKITQIYRSHWLGSAGCLILARMRRRHLHAHRVSRACWTAFLRTITAPVGASYPRLRKRLPVLTPQEARRVWTRLLTQRQGSTGAAARWSSLLRISICAEGRMTCARHTSYVCGRQRTLRRSLSLLAASAAHVPLVPGRLGILTDVLIRSTRLGASYRGWGCRIGLCGAVWASKETQQRSACEGMCCVLVSRLRRTWWRLHRRGRCML